MAINPKPVTSVTAVARFASSTAAASRLERRISASAASIEDALAFPRMAAATIRRELLLREHSPDAVR
jgi:hypothetical protein